MSDTTAPKPTPPPARCKWYVSIFQPECGRISHHKVTVTGKVTKAVVDLCDEHKAEHDRRFAEIRAAHAAVSN